jgi:hypothetical protein
MDQLAVVGRSSRSAIGAERWDAQRVRRLVALRRFRLALNISDCHAILNLFRAVHCLVGAVKESPQARLLARCADDTADTRGNHHLNTVYHDGLVDVFLRYANQPRTLSKS